MLRCLLTKKIFDGTADLFQQTSKKNVRLMSKMTYNKAYYQANRERICLQSRERYMRDREIRNAMRRAKYQVERRRLLDLQKADRTACPLCGLTFRRRYMPRHLSTRHADV